MSNETPKKAVKNKRAGGRPTKYKPEYCQQIIDFFDVEPYEDVEIPHYHPGTKKVVWTDKKRMPRKLPTLRDFGKSVAVDYSTVWNWTQEHKEFFDAVTRAEELRKDFLIQNGLQGLYNPKAFTFVAVNLTDMRDKKEQTTTSAVTITLGDEERAILRDMGAKLLDG